VGKWEYKDVRVETEILVEHEHGPLDPSFMMPLDQAKYDRLVREALQREAQEGWEPDEPIDWWSKVQQDKAYCVYESGFLQSLVGKRPLWIFQGVDVRLRRLVTE
jgi:hypothetical protein